MATNPLAPGFGSLCAITGASLGTPPYMIVFARPVGNVATDIDDTSCKHGKDPSDAHRTDFKADFRRPANDTKADFYPARQCSPERPDEGKRASPSTTVITVLGGC